MVRRQQLLFLELNEICFDSVSRYCGKGLLPNLSKLISERGWSVTTSETSYEHLEPWIQWVTAHTGRDFHEHGVFRLGDIVNHDIPQIWEVLEERGLKVGAISPMNAKYRAKDAAFFLPDPWTSTGLRGPWLLRRLYGAVAQAVNDNAKNAITPGSLLALLAGVIRYARPARYARYMRLALGARSNPWYRALFLDLLLSDVFEVEVRRTRPDFATLFLNAGAHIQHHYMFSSSVYAGSQRNPAWYVSPGVDPLLDVYELYDHIVGRMIREFPDARFMIATGLRQVPYPKVTYYWRLRGHADFLALVGVPFQSVSPRMSRDFLVSYRDAAEAERAAECLRSISTEGGEALFEVDNRGRDLFVVLSFSGPVDHSTYFVDNQAVRRPLEPHIAFVALKNGEHDGRGYFIDSGSQHGKVRDDEFPLRDIPLKVAQALGIEKFQIG